MTSLSEDFFFCSAPHFGQKVEPNLSEDLFFFIFYFCSAPDFGQKIGPNLNEDLFSFSFALHLILGKK